MRDRPGRHRQLEENIPGNENSLEPESQEPPSENGRVTGSVGLEPVAQGRSLGYSSALPLDSSPSEGDHSRCSELWRSRMSQNHSCGGWCQDLAELASSQPGDAFPSSG